MATAEGRTGGPFDAQGDLPIQEASEVIQALVEKIPGLIPYFKWTCGGCGDRCAFDDPYVIYTSAIHTERDDGSACGFTTQVERVGIRLLFPPQALTNPAVRELVEQARAAMAYTGRVH